MKMKLGNWMRIRLEETNWAGFRRALKLLSIGLSAIPFSLSAQIVSNLGQTDDTVLFIRQNLWRGTQITTGSNAGGYTLVSMTGAFNAQIGTPSGFQTSVYSDDSTSPGTLLETLSGSDPTTAGNHTYTSTGLSLDANTSYWLVFTEASGDGFFNFDATTSDAETSSDGWSIGDFSGFSGDQGANWNANADTKVMLFSVQATPVPEPHEYAMFVGLGLLGFVAVRRRFPSVSLA